MGHIKSFTEAFDTLKKSFFFLLWVLVFVVLSCFGIVIYVYQTADHKVYIISPDQTMKAESDYNHQVTVYEIRNHIKAFCSTIFAWDKDNYNANIEYAMNLVDHVDGLKIFNTFKEHEVYENLVSTSARVTIHIDSIIVQMHTLPYKGIFYLTQSWITAAGTQLQGISARFEVLPVTRTDLNPFGLLLQKIDFVEYNRELQANNSQFNQSVSEKDSSLNK